MKIIADCNEKQFIRYTFKSEIDFEMMKGNTNKYFNFVFLLMKYSIVILGYLPYDIE